MSPVVTALIVAAIRQTTIADVPNPVLGLQWHPQANRLFWMTEKELHSWPDGRKWKLPLGKSGFSTFSTVTLRFNASRSKLLLSGRSTDFYILLDLATGRIQRVDGIAHLVWWIGDELAMVRPVVKNGEWTDSDILQIGQRKSSLPKTWQVGATDGSILLTKDTRRFEGPIALYRVDPRTLKLTRFRVHPQKFYNESVSQDSIAWNETLKTAAVGLTSDTGGTFAALYVSTPQGIRSADNTGTYLLTGDPMWVGNRLLFSTREFREDSSKRINHGADIYRIRLFDPVRKTLQLLEKIDNHWTWDGEKDEVPKRADQPTLENAVATADGKRLAYVRAALGRSRIIIRP